MSNIFSDFFTTRNNPKLDEMLAKTRDMAETVSKKSAEHLELSRKRVELLDTKSKLSIPKSFISSTVIGSARVLSLKWFICEF